MKNKLDDVTQSIKSKLSFDDYTPSNPNAIITEKHKDILPLKLNYDQTSNHNDVNTECHKDIKKVKRTFYIREEVADKLDALYAQKIMQKKKIDKSDIVTQALINLFLEDECEIERF